MNKNVLIKVLKDPKFVASRADRGRLFHRKGAATWKALSPIVFLVFALGTDSLVVSAPQDEDGHALSRQNNLTFGIRLHEVCVRTGGQAYATS